MDGSTGSALPVQHQLVTRNPGDLSGVSISPGLCFTLCVLVSWSLARARHKEPKETQKDTGNTDTIFLSNALPVTVTGSI